MRAPVKDEHRICDLFFSSMLYRNLFDPKMVNGRPTIAVELRFYTLVAASFLRELRLRLVLGRWLQNRSEPLISIED